MKALLTVTCTVQYITVLHYPYITEALSDPEAWSLTNGGAFIDNSKSGD